MGFALPGVPEQPTSEKRCPRCRSDWIVWLVQMRQYDETNDYYRCRQCDHEFTLSRPEKA